MKNRDNFNVGDKVIIVRTHGDDLNKIGTIVDIRCSFCKIQIEDYKKPVNHCYGQFKKI